MSSQQSHPKEQTWMKKYRNYPIFVVEIKLSSVILLPFFSGMEISFDGWRYHNVLSGYVYTSFA